MTLYGSLGHALAYSDDGIHIFLFSGEPVAYVSNGSLYSDAGKHLGWLANGWVRDHSGRCVLFTDRASGGPPMPEKGQKPPRAQREPQPLKARQSPAPPSPRPLDDWSHLSGVQFLATR